MSDTWVQHVWIGEQVLIWGEKEGVPFEVRLSGEALAWFDKEESKADAIIRNACLVSAGVA